MKINRPVWELALSTSSHAHIPGLPEWKGHILPSVRRPLSSPCFPLEGAQDAHVHGEPEKNQKRLAEKSPKLMNKDKANQKESRSQACSC